MDVRTVSEVTKYIKLLFDRERVLRGILISGEVSNFKRYPSGHCYFTLKDAQASLKCVMFKSSADRLKFKPENGMKVVVSGSISIYERDGVYQLYANNMVPEGIGELAAAYEQLKAKLEAEGLFAPERKKALPPYPKTIGIVTSSAGAVLRDIFNVSKRRDPSIRLVLYPVKVQGDGSAEQIAQGIEFFNTRYPVDVLIVGRGGGSKEDLWSFNEEIVVRAVAASEIPIISAVGHETDFSLSDFAADVRAATPSQAAELAVPDTTLLVRRIEELTARLNSAKVKILAAKRRELKICLGRSFFNLPKQAIAQRRQTLDDLSNSLKRWKEQIFAAKRQNVLTLVDKLDILNPARNLKRGYGVVEKDKMLVHSVDQLTAGDALEVTLSDGAVTTRVESVRKVEFLNHG